MDKDDELRHQARAEPGATGADAPAAAFIERWARMRAQLSPLIGENGFTALFGRAVGLAAPRFDCLALDPTPKNGDQLFAALAQGLSANDAATMRAANDALMDAFTRQLIRLIGAALTERLLASVSEDGDGQDKDRSTSK
jgi:hypothetical protein